jgi:hypothetical protein
VGDEVCFRVAGADRGSAGALALARRIVAGSGRAVEPMLVWRTSRVDAVAALADRLTTATFDVCFESAEPGPLLAALAAEEPGQVQVHQPGPGPRFSLHWTGGHHPAELSLWFPEPGREPPGWAERFARRMARIRAAGLLPPADVERVLGRTSAPELRFELPRPAMAGADPLWCPGPPVAVTASFDLHPASAVRAARLGAAQVEVTAGWQDAGPAEEPLIDAVVADVGADPLEVVWDCWFDGWARVLLCCNSAPDRGPRPGVHDVHLVFDRRSSDLAPLAAAVAARSGETVDPVGRVR